MKLVEINVKDFRGLSRAWQLSGVDVITGPNGIGKSRWLQAVQLGLTGAIPDSNKDKNIDELDFFSKNVAKQKVGVNLYFEGGELSSISRIYDTTAKAGKESVTQLINLSPATLVNGMKGTTEIEKKFKSIIGDVAIAVDVSEFIRMSDDKRVALISQFCPIDLERWKAETIRDRLAQAIELKFGIMEKLQVELLDETMAMVGEGELAGIPRVIEQLKELESTLKKEVKVSQSTTQGALNLNEADGKKSLRHVEDIRKEIESAKNSKDALSAKINTSRSTKTAWDRLNQEKLELKVSIEKAKANTEQDKTASLKQTIEEFTPKANVNLDEMSNNLTDMKNSMQTFATDLYKKGAEIEALDKEMLRQQKLEVQLKSGKCPTCGQDCLHVVGDIEGEIKNLSERRGDLHHEFGELQARSDKMKKECAKMEEEIAYLQKEQRHAMLILQNAKNELAGLVGAAHGISQLEERLAKLEQTSVPGEMINIEEAELQLTGIKERITKLESELSEKIQYDSKLELTKKSAANAKISADKLECVKVLIEESKSIRWEIVKSALTPIRDEASDLLSWVVDHAKAEFDFQFIDPRGNEVCRIGWTVKNESGEFFVDFDSLSTAQQVFTIVALLAPLINRSNPQLRLLCLDNCEVVDDHNREGFLRLLVKAKSLYLDNVLAASSANFTVVPQEITVHNLTI